MQDHEDRTTFTASIKGGLKGKLESHFSIVLRSMAIEDPSVQSGVKYVFATNKVPGINISAKSPPEMLGGPYIDNDIAPTIEKIKNFYK